MNLELSIDQLLAQRRAPKQYVAQCDVCGRVGAAGPDRGAALQTAAAHSADTGHDVRAAAVRIGGKRRSAKMTMRGGKRRHGKWIKRFRAAASDHDTYTREGGGGVHSDVTYEPSQGGWVAHVYQDGQWQGTSTGGFGTPQAAMKDGDHLVAHVEHFAKKGQKPARPWGQYESQKRMRAGGKGRHAAPEKVDTPYTQHAKFGHHMSRYSPNGYDIIEECDVCGMRWLHHPGDKYPVTMHPRAVGGKRRRAVATKVGPRGGRTEIQSYLFPRSHWTLEQVKRWAKKSTTVNYFGDVDVTDKYIRLRQADPKKFKRMRTKCLSRRKGKCVIKAVVGVR